MKIKKIRLKNGYKRFHNLTIDLGPEPARIVGLLGPNGSGKSSVFDGMLYLANAHDAIGSIRRQDAAYHSMSNEPGFNHQNVEIELTSGPFSTVFENRRATGKQKTIFSFRSPYRYNSQVKIKEVRSLDEIAKNSYGASSASAIDEKMDQNYRRLSAYYNDYLEKKDCKPSEAKAFIIGELNKSIKACLDIQIDNLGNVEADKGTLYFTKYDQPTPFEFDVLSSGEKEVVDILLDIFLRRDAYSDSIFLIDEPELHINTAIQKHLLTEINRLVGADCQIWVATHSIGLMRALQTDFKDQCQIIHFEPGTKFASEAVTLKPVPKNHHTWRRIFSTALDDLSELVSPRQIIYCEGKDKPGQNGEKGFDARVYNSIFGTTRPDTLFVSSGGNTELDQRSEIAIKILSKVFADLEILVLKDRDFHSGASATLQDRVEYLKTNPKNHRMLERREIENYLYDLEILEKFCERRSSEFKVDIYKSFVTDILNQNVKDNVSKIKECCSLSQNYGTEKLNFELAELVMPDTKVFAELNRVIFESGEISR